MSERDHAARMDAKYRRVRHVYDLTRKYFLFGRDHALEILDPRSASSILEIGCGTGRNLRAIARLAPEAEVHGIDISAEMLKSAGGKTASLKNVRLRQADATTLDTERLFGNRGYDAVLMSYSLSMVPDWKAALAKAIKAVGPGGRLVVVDFGRFEGYGRFGPMIVEALSKADAPPLPDLHGAVTRAISGRSHLRASFGKSMRGYYVWAVVERANR
ncbi:class I SAM-dependent methyltransferase [Pararhizobium sp. BT-229]|uniref:class I SAM-dependent methyltransferase n=1 Tax=Pararhizobium sp. BT-229 TaxID=2986923 RepID=UPI0021F73B8D|nr:class I SAM-dependent methyltransferase [Pararhizobium sp. BT-229]MCV9963968.1 class I SAM-dependent methyltransferase [Pararhizobium sp. BT-229]